MTATLRPARRPAPAPSRPDRHLRVVPDGYRSPRSRRRRARLAALAVAALAATVVFGLVSFQVVLSEGQVRLEELRRRAAAEQERYDRLRLEVAELESPGRVIAMAQQRLGMVVPPGVTYLSPSGVAVAARPAPAATSPTDDGEGRWPAVKAHLAGRP
jgi:cell division protein FtsL